MYSEIGKTWHKVFHEKEGDILSRAVLLRRGPTIERLEKPSRLDRARMLGYKAKEGAINTPSAIHGMELVYLIAPVVFVMLGGACFIGYRLDSKRHAEIRAELERRDALIPEAAVLESLSGGQGVTTRMAEPT